MGSIVQGFCTNPLLSSSFKKHDDVTRLLISYGADPKVTEEYNKKTHGFRLSEEQVNYLYSAHTIMKILYLKNMQRRMKKKPIFGQLSDIMID